jgi:hypothetical protein
MVCKCKGRGRGRRRDRERGDKLRSGEREKQLRGLYIEKDRER